MKLSVSLYGLWYKQVRTEGRLGPLSILNYAVISPLSNLRYLYCSLVYIARSGVTYSNFTEYYCPNASRKEPANIPVCEHHILWLILANFPLDFAKLISEKWYLTFISLITGDCFFMLLGQFTCIVSWLSPFFFSVGFYTDLLRAPKLVILGIYCIYFYLTWCMCFAKF